MNEQRRVPAGRSEAVVRGAAPAAVVSPARAQVGARLPILLVVLAASIPFLPSLSADFSGDDYGLVQHFAHQPTFHTLTLFTRPWTESIYGIVADELRPTVALSYQVDSIWDAGSATGYHASSIAVHVLNSLLVLAVARRVARLGWLAATLAALLFAVLPIHADTITWISGRADSIPALFYLTAFLAYARWRCGGGWWLYGATVVALFLALFSKQSAITMPATAVCFDLLVARRAPRLSWHWLAPYLPLSALVVGYLALRYILFGNAVREHSLSSDLLATFLQLQGSFLKSLLFGSSIVGAERVTPELASLGLGLVWTGLGLGAVWLACELWRTIRGQPRSPSGVLAFFTIAWWLIGIAPLIVTYEAPRHLYLAAVGPVVAFASVIEQLRQSCRALLRYGAPLVALTSLLVSCYFLQLGQADWTASAAVAGKIKHDLEREVLAAPPGSLIVVGAPASGPRSRHHTWIWGWALPFAARPPFTSVDLTARAYLVEPPDVYCCPSDQWLAHVKESVSSWSARPDRPPVLVLRWSQLDGTLTRLSEAADPSVRDQAAALAAAGDWIELCWNLNSLLADTIAAHCPLRTDVQRPPQGA